MARLRGWNVVPTKKIVWEERGMLVHETAVFVHTLGNRRKTENGRSVHRLAATPNAKKLLTVVAGSFFVQREYGV